MNRKRNLLALLTVAAWLLVSSGPLSAQVVFCPSEIIGTARFSNVNPAILTLLNAPNDEGMVSIRCVADSVPPGRSSSSPYLVASGRTSTGYRMTVDGTDAGVSYNVRAGVNLGLGRPGIYQQTYSFAARPSAPVVCGAKAPVVEFSECAGVVELHFVDSAGSPVPVSYVQPVNNQYAVTANDATAPGLETGSLLGIPDGTTVQRLYLRGGMTHRLAIRVYRGGDLYTDRIEFSTIVNVAAVCDDTVGVNIVVPTGATLGRIVGTVDMQGEFEWSIDGNDSLNYTDATGVIARYGPFANQRWASLGGDNRVVPSSGDFTLGNIVPSTLDPTSPGYTVNAGMYFRSNRRFQGFATPSLGSGGNPAVPVPSGTTVNLSNLFVINPGYLRGNIVLRGAAERVGVDPPSMLRGLQHWGDTDLDGDGIPDRAGTYGVTWSLVAAEGVDRRASGAEYSASGGYASTDFDGAFEAGTPDWRGSYELVLGGLKGQRSLWRQAYLGLTFESGPGVPATEYYSTGVAITDRQADTHEIVPTAATTKDLAYCFGEVIVLFQAREGTFHTPQILASRGEFVGTDFQGQPADYTVYLDHASGTPLAGSAPSDHGQVRLVLPQGTYTLYPSVRSPDGSEIALPAIASVTVGCGGRSVIGATCLKLDLTIPPCSNSRLLALDGLVNSCTNVTKITYQIDDRPPQLVCSDCGVNPPFSLSVPIDGLCEEHSLTVTAADANGSITSQSGTVRFDNVPPQITCPTNVVAACAGPGGTAVHFPNIAVTDNCSGLVTVVCTPPSGSLFPQGVTMVSCKATDACGNEAKCEFPVTVGPSRATIESAICVRWDCGALQQSVNVDGPWEDVPGAISPYYAPASGPHRFYRIRN